MAQVLRNISTVFVHTEMQQHQHSMLQQVEAVKQQISELISVPPDKLKLVHKGKPIQDETAVLLADGGMCSFCATVPAYLKGGEYSQHHCHNDVSWHTCRHHFGNEGKAANILSCHQL